MFPPPLAVHLDINAISGICGSVSIACWIVVFSPQIIENFRRQSADGLSLLFLVVWLAGDVFNILGAVMQGVLPTMTILAVYYTFADLVLLGQCFYYRGFTLSDKVKPAEAASEPTESTGLIHASPTVHPIENAHHLSPATPLLDAEAPASQSLKPTSTLQAIAFNTSALGLVCLAGAFGWYVSTPRRTHSHRAQESAGDEPLDFNVAGQVFGYLCAALYLGSRVPQILLNHRRKSTEGVSMLFFLFACVGNLTYVMSILAYAPTCGHRHSRGCAGGEAGRLYGKYVLVNASWLLGSLGTLMLDLGIFVQFFLYRRSEA